jgi:hypothetical protein
MDPILVGAAGTYAVGSALALGAVAGRPAYLVTKAAVLWAAEKVVRLVVRVVRLARRPGFEKSASWWVDQHKVRPVARHRARGLARAALRRRARRIALATAVLVDELTLSARIGVAA